MSIDSRLERLPIFGLTVAVLFGSLFVKYIHDVDMYWQLQFGEIIARTGRLPSHEPFLAGKDGVANVPICWLSQVIYYQLWSLGGWPLLQIVEGAIWLGGYAAVAWALRRSGAWGWPAALALLYGYLPAYTFASIRPQTFALLGFGLMMALTWSRIKLWKKLLLGAILFVVWQNAHPSVLMAGVWLGPMTIGAVVRWLRRPTGERGAFPWDLAGLSALAIAASMACPDPIETLKVARVNEQMSKHLDVSEWKPLIWPDWEGAVDWQSRGCAVLAIAILPVLVVWRGRRLKVEELVTAAILIALTWQMYRFSTFLGFALIPIAYRALAPAPGTPPPPPMIRSWRAILAGAFAVAVAVSLTRFAVAEIAAPQRTPIDPHMDYFPFEAVARMKEVVPPGTVFCDFFWGGVVVRANYPDWKVSHDGRYYHFTADEWDWYKSAMWQQPVGRYNVTVPEIVTAFRPVAFLLWASPDEALIRKLDAADSGWIRLRCATGRDGFDRGQAVVFVPR